MSKHTTTTIAARTPRTDATPALPLEGVPGWRPSLTDPHLLALLAFIAGPDVKENADGDIAEDYATIAAIAHALMATPPLTLSFSTLLGRPELCELVINKTRADFLALDDGLDHVDMLDSIQRHADEPLLTDRADHVFDLLVSCIHDATLVGACAMYELLKGGGR